VGSGQAAETEEMEGERQEWGAQGSVRRCVRPRRCPASDGEYSLIKFRITIPWENFLVSCPFGQLAEDFAGFERRDREGGGWQVAG